MPHVPLLMIRCRCRQPILLRYHTFAFDAAIFLLALMPLFRHTPWRRVSSRYEAAAPRLATAAARADTLDSALITILFRGHMLTLRPMPIRCFAAEPLRYYFAPFHARYWRHVTMPATPYICQR